MALDAVNLPPVPSCVPLPLSILTGFLGAGKTTLLGRLLAEPGLENTAVIINEFGEIGLDHLLVEASSEGIVELQGGCLCCTIRGDLVTTLQDLLTRRDARTLPPFERIIIETTGLADPAPILHTVMYHPWLVHRLRLESVVTVIDAATGLDTLDTHAEAVKQAAVADRLVLTKTDIPEGRAARDELVTRLGALNPGARILQSEFGEAVAARLFDAGLYDPSTKSPDVEKWLRADAYGPPEDHPGHAHDKGRHDDRIAAFCLTHDAPISLEGLEMFLDLLRSRFGANLLRLKAIVALIDQPECPLVLHGVQHIFHPPVRLECWPGGKRQTRLVCILRDADPGEVDALFKAFANPATGRRAYSALNDANPLAPGGGEFIP